eukprot:SAG31_NODE_574_length_13967_cov_7.512042_18_plen_51_part_00
MITTTRDEEQEVRIRSRAHARYRLCYIYFKIYSGEKSSELDIEVTVRTPC